MSRRSWRAIARRVGAADERVPRAGPRRSAVQPAAGRRAIGSSPRCTRRRPGGEVRVAVIDSGVELDHPDLAGQVGAERRLRRRSRRPRRDPRHGGRRHHRRPAPTTTSASSASRRRRACLHCAPAGRQRRPRRCARQPEPGAGLALRDRARCAGHQPEPGRAARPADRAARRGRARARHQRRRRGRSARCPTAASRPRFAASSPSSMRGARRSAGMVARPGRDVPATLPGSRWAMVSGASYAAAHVSGLLALMLEAQARRAAARARVASRDLVL